ncbi:efflux RND transporter periplasmic adaptor subunit [Novosphingobium ovatum]|uniref:efflux RND transporter periplasmic adaptor subunit n=1 Tax=Novosphingobium ovatum TaxID=1908523 RepID=UPI0029FEF62B|nr:efflux RND transporter periplasmic adaptor subunit [Novosphingobium ovatum]
MKAIVGWTIGIAALGVAGAGLWHWRHQPATVAYARVGAGPAADLVYATGYVEAQQPVSVAARITAPVARILVAEGDRVQAGQVLAILDNTEQQGLLAQAAAQARSAETVERRTVALYRDGWVTGAARDSAVANADAARAARATASARLDQLMVRASAAGVVIKRDVYPGDLATPAKVLFQLGDPKQIRITATVDERDITRVRVGQSALMTSDAFAGRVIRAHVAEVTPAGDPTARAFRVRLLPDEAVSLPMGLTLEVNIIARENAHAVLIPPAAVSGGKVWVVEGGKAHQRAVTLGAAGKENTEVTAGLKVGETVILSPPADLAEGAAVRPAPAPAATAKP